MRACHTAQGLGVARGDLRARTADAEIIEASEQEAGGAGRVERRAGQVGRAREIAGHELGRADQLVRRRALVLAIVAREGRAHCAAIIPAQLAAQVPIVIGTFLGGAVIASGRECVEGGRVVRSLVGIGQALQEAVARLDAEGESGAKAIGDRHRYRPAHLEQLVAAQRHVALGFECVTRIGRDDGDRAADRIAAEQSALRPLQYFHPLDIEQILVRADRAGEIDAVEINADARIDVEGEIVGPDTANIGGQNGGGTGKGRARVQIDVGRDGGKLRHAADGALLQGFSGKGRNGDRHILHIFRALLRRDDDFGDAARLFGILRQQRRAGHRTRRHQRRDHRLAHLQSSHNGPPVPVCCQPS